VVEHFLGKEEVKGSIPFNGSNRQLLKWCMTAADSPGDHNSSEDLDESRKIADSVCQRADDSQ
jgi:hypothetical protein